MIVDLATFAAFTLIALKSNRFWPLWVSRASAHHNDGALSQGRSISDLLAASLCGGARFLELSDPDHCRDRHLAHAPAAHRSRAEPSGLIGRSRRGGLRHSRSMPMEAACRGARNLIKVTGQRIGHACGASMPLPQRSTIRTARCCAPGRRGKPPTFMQFPKDVPVTLADVADLGRLVPHDAPHQGVVIEVEPLEDVWLDDLLADAARASRAARARSGHRSAQCRRDPPIDRRVRGGRHRHPGPPFAARERRAGESCVGRSGARAVGAGGQPCPRARGDRRSRVLADRSRRRRGYRSQGRARAAARGAGAWRRRARA